MPTPSSSLLSTGFKISLLTFKVYYGGALEILAAVDSLESAIFAVLYSLVFISKWNNPLKFLLLAMNSPMIMPPSASRNTKLAF